MDALASQTIFPTIWPDTGMAAEFVTQAETELKGLEDQVIAVKTAEKRDWEPKSLALAVTVAAIMIIVGAVLLGNVVQNVPIETRTVQFMIRQPGFIVMACAPCAVIIALVGKSWVDQKNSHLVATNAIRRGHLKQIVHYKDAGLRTAFNQFIQQHNFTIQPKNLYGVCYQFCFYKQHQDEIAKLEPQSIAARDEWCKLRQEDIKEASEKEIEAELAVGRKWLDLSKKVAVSKREQDHFMGLMTGLCGALECPKSQT